MKTIKKLRIIKVFKKSNAFHQCQRINYIAHSLKNFFNSLMTYSINIEIIIIKKNKKKILKFNQKKKIKNKQKNQKTILLFSFPLFLFCKTSTI